MLKVQRGIRAKLEEGNGYEMDTEERAGLQAGNRKEKERY